MKKLYIISLFLMLIYGGVVIVERSVSTAQKEADLSVDGTRQAPANLPGERETFHGVNASANLHDSAASSNISLEAYYARRAYHGAPPAIPHPVENEMSFGGKTCLQCHGKGGYVPKWEAFAPVTPHPDKINCRQCHGPALTDELFRETNWDATTLHLPPLHNQALPGSPPPIPHSLFLHGSCVSCHAGPSAPKELRIDHADRINCRQCHVPSENTEDIEPFFKELK